MNYDVIWSPRAMDRLAQMWMGATDKAAVTDASYRISQLLSVDPLTAGESRPRRRRILFDPPLCVVFKVNAADRRVDVLSVGWSGRPV